MNHIAFASSIPFVAALLVYLSRRRAGLGWLILTPLAMGLCSIWAVVPDLPRLWKDMGLYHRLNLDPRCDIFFFHHSIDGTESDSSWWGAVVALMAGTLLLVAWRELRRLEASGRE